MTGKAKGSKAKRKTRTNRARPAPIREQLSGLSRKIHEAKEELRELRCLAGEGVLAAEVILLQSRGSAESEGYESLRREALRSLVLAEGVVKKLGLAIDLRPEWADKYTFGASTALCDELVSLCRGACCREKFPLTAQDIVEGVVEFDLDDPYMIKMSPSGYCIHCDPESMKCGIWEQRPARCRLYTCRWSGRPASQSKRGASDFGIQKTRRLSVLFTSNAGGSKWPRRRREQPEKPKRPRLIRHF